MAFGLSGLSSQMQPPKYNQSQQTGMSLTEPTVDPNNIFGDVAPLGPGALPENQENQPQLDPNASVYYQQGGPGQAPIYTENNPNWANAYGQSGGGSSQNSGFQQFDPSQYAMDSRYLERMRDIAFADPGTSPWLKYQMQQDALRQQSDIDALQSQGASSLATQQGNLAMRGGLTSGAAERLGSQNLMGSLMGRQQLSRSAAAREAGYRQQAEERQRDVLTQLPTAEQNYAQYGANLEQYRLNQYNKELAAQRLADAIRAQGGDPSIIESLMGMFGSGNGPTDLLKAPLQIFDPNNY